MAKSASTPRVTGKHVIQDLIANRVTLIPMVITPLGHIGPITRHILYDTGDPTPGDIAESHPMAGGMMARTLNAECPSEIVTQHACANWKRQRPRQF